MAFEHERVTRFILALVEDVIEPLVGRSIDGEEYYELEDKIREMLKGYEGE